jgi:hypothetical protein
MFMSFPVEWPAIPAGAQCALRHVPCQDFPEAATITGCNYYHEWNKCLIQHASGE